MADRQQPGSEAKWSTDSLAKLAESPVTRVSDLADVIAYRTGDFASLTGVDPKTTLDYWIKVNLQDIFGETEDFPIQLGNPNISIITAGSEGEFVEIGTHFVNGRNVTFAVRADAIVEDTVNTPLREIELFIKLDPLPEITEEDPTES